MGSYSESSPLISDLWVHGIPVHSTSLPHPRDSIRNCALSMDQIPDLHSPLSPISESPGSPAYSTGKLAGGSLCLVGNITYLSVSASVLGAVPQECARKACGRIAGVDTQSTIFWIAFPPVPGSRHKMGPQCEWQGKVCWRYSMPWGQPEALMGWARCLAPEDKVPTNSCLTKDPSNKCIPRSWFELRPG